MSQLRICRARPFQAKGKANAKSRGEKGLGVLEEPKREQCEWNTENKGESG